MIKRGIAFLLVTLVASAALATEFEADSTPATSAPSHTGFMTRLSVGFGGSRIAPNDYDATLGGIAAVYDLALGYSVMPRLALHVSYFGARAMAPTLEVNGSEAKPADDAESSLNGVGAGLTYYLPSNFFVSPALGLGIIEGVDPSPAKRDTLNAGFAAGLTIGYEWMVSENWGLGAAASCYYFRAKDTDGPIDLTWQGFAAGPAFSATYN